jgi:hypothetical protein
MLAQQAEVVNVRSLWFFSSTARNIDRSLRRGTNVRGQFGFFLESLNVHVHFTPGTIVWIEPKPGATLVRFDRFRPLVGVVAARDSTCVLDKQDLRGKLPVIVRDTRRKARLVVSGELPWGINHCNPEDLIRFAPAPGDELVVRKPAMSVCGRNLPVCTRLETITVEPDGALRSLLGDEVTIVPRHTIMPHVP